MKRKIIILISVLLSIVSTTSFAILINQGECVNLATSQDDLFNKIKNSNQEFKRTIIKCLKHIETTTSILPTPLDIRNEDFIKTLIKSYNNQFDCFYFNINDIYPAPPYRYEDSIMIEGIDFEKLKNIDNSGDQNCRINTEFEKCSKQLEIEKRDKPAKTNTKIRTMLYGCYGNDPKPKFFKDFQGQDLGINNFEVFSDEKGLTANTEQKKLLNKLSQNRGGPVISVINIVINYLAGIVFVLCMASLIYGGYNLIFAGFDSDMVEKGKNAIKYAITGFFLIMLSYTIVILVQSIF